MIRVLMYLIGALVAITFLRGVIGILGRAFSNHAGKSSAPKEDAPPRQTTTATPPKAVGGELKRCAVCGIYAPAHSNKGEVYFCSAECEQKYQAA
ncbi:MAG: hypothetical protein K2Q23_18865 [Bryobacteraceae bacterium]|nr:hypothetical protein [Bryobacteraceae bacterium]